MGIAKIGYKKIAKRKEKFAYDFKYFLNGINSSLDESIQNTSNASFFKNFSIKKGTLNTGLGLQPLKFWSTSFNRFTTYNKTYDGKALKLYCFPFFDEIYENDADMIFVYTSIGELWYMKYTSQFRNFDKCNCPTFSTPPKFLYYIMPDGGQVGIFCSKTQPLTMINYGRDCVVVQNAPKIKSLCVHYDRIFVCVEDDAKAVWFSDEMNPLNWNISNTEGGFLKMNDTLGDCVKILSFQNYIFVFREYGITKITAFSSQDTFSMQNVYLSSNYIYANTACICGDLIYFIATDGVYVFNGVSVKKVSVGFEKIFINQNQKFAKGVYYKNSYYLILNTNLSDLCFNEDGLNSIIRLDCEDFSYDILSDVNVIDIEKMNSSGIECLAVIECFETQDQEGYDTKLSSVDFVGEVDSMPTIKEWSSPYTDLGNALYHKNICGVALQTSCDCDVIIRTENGQVQVNFKGSEKSQSKPIFISGVMVQVSIVCRQKEAMISHPKIFYRLGKANA